jgi:hypothetical protein
MATVGRDSWHKDSPEYHANMTVDQAYERRFHDYHGDIRVQVSGDLDPG